jgi:hypothetical protein
MFVKNTSKACPISVVVASACQFDEARAKHGENMGEPKGNETSSTQSSVTTLL